MTDEDFTDRYRTMQRYLGWSEADAERVRTLRPLVEPHARNLVSDFYAEIRRHPEARKVITGGSEQMARLSRTLLQWLAELLTGPYDDEYMARRWKVGHRHVEIGLAQRYASLALGRLRAGLARSVEAEWRGDASELRANVASLHKLLDIEHALIQDAYEFEYVRRERQLERERSERKFRHLVESASCLIVILNAGHDVVYFNPYAEQTTGYRAEDLRHDRGRVFSLLGHSGPVMNDRISSVLFTGATTSYEEQVQVRTGPRRWISWTLSRIDEFDEGAAVLAVGHDVTDARQAAEQLLQASRLATIGEMYAGLAHESRNALQRLRVCTDLLAETVSDRPAAVALIERSEKAQEDLQQLLDEVRSYASPMVLDRTECRLTALCRESWNLLQTQRRGRQAELVDDNCDPTQFLRADRFRMVQAFRNILENSLAACPDPVIIRLFCREIAIDGREFFEVTLEDNGPGFDEAASHRAFEPFFTTKPTGTGLGLAIVRRIVEAHGGRVSGSRGARGGARISMTLPASLND